MDINDLKLNPDDYAETETEGKRKYKRLTKPFVKGPIPLDWIQQACRLGSNVARLSWVLWYFDGVKKEDYFNISNINVEKFGIERRQKNKALSLLEEAGLITIKQEEGKSPRVKVIKDIQ
ncbi:MAG: hypothetical protein KAW01_00455 [Deltaproteobacteria bacterium]|nr:hypothetical protein [Deltaproteobacteria bacterium]